jgi:hypothetical protein
MLREFFFRDLIPLASKIESSDEVVIGDIVKPNIGNQKCVVLYRENDIHHSLLLTNPYNSYCFMRFQSPTKHENSWLITEALGVIRRIRMLPVSIGLSGCEPLLKPVSLRRVIKDISLRHPLKFKGIGESSNHNSM